MPTKDKFYIQELEDGIFFNIGPEHNWEDFLEILDYVLKYTGADYKIFGDGCMEGISVKSRKKDY